MEKIRMGSFREDERQLSCEVGFFASRGILRQSILWRPRPVRHTGREEIRKRGRKRHGIHIDVSKGPEKPNL